MKFFITNALRSVGIFDNNQEKQERNRRTKKEVGKQMGPPDSKQSSGQRWVMVGVFGNTSLLACYHWPNIGPTLKFQQLLAQRWNFNYAPTVDFELWGQCWPKTMLTDNSRVIFLSIFILIMQKLYNLLLGENSVILFYNNIFMIKYLVILSDF